MVPSRILLNTCWHGLLTQCIAPFYRFHVNVNHCVPSAHHFNSHVCRFLFGESILSQQLLTQSVAFYFLQWRRPCFLGFSPPPNYYLDLNTHLTCELQDSSYSIQTINIIHTHGPSSLFRWTQFQNFSTRSRFMPCWTFPRKYSVTHKNVVIGLPWWYSG